MSKLKTHYTFTKEWTREYPILTQWIWYQHITHCLDDYLGKTNPYQPVIIDYVHDGLIEIFENRKALQWFKDQLLQLNKKNKNFLKDTLKKYKIINNKLKKIYTSKNRLTKNAAILFLNLWDEGVKYYAIFLYTFNNIRTPKKIRKMAIDFYHQDRYYIDGIPYIKKVLTTIYPKLGTLSYWILPHELMHNIIPSITELKKREKNFVLIPGIVQETTSLNNFLKKHPEYVLHEPGSLEGTVLKGQVAYPGIARGKVSIIKKYEQIKKFKAGSIIVSPMTMPDYVPVMQKALAFVTDEGGTTCHASVMARELKKPCIVGTKIATKILKNGDMIEVNANTGTVKKL